MKRLFQTPVIISALFAAGNPVLLPQQAAPIITKNDSPSMQQAEAAKQLTEIMKEQNATRQVPMLEQYVRDHPNLPSLMTAYSYLLSALMTSNCEKALVLADQVLTKYPGQNTPIRSTAYITNYPNTSIRSTAYSTKFYVFESLKKDVSIKALGAKILETEMDPAILEMAALHDQADSLALLNKAISERQKNRNPAASPTLNDLHWAYVESLREVGRRDEALKLALEVTLESEQEIAALQALPDQDTRKRRLNSLQQGLVSRYRSLSSIYAAAGDYQKALEALDLGVMSAGENILEERASLEERRAYIYIRMRKPELALESYARSYAAGVDIMMHDRIIQLAQRAGKKPEAVFEQARQIRNQSAVPIKEFELKNIAGPVMKLSEIKSKVLLVNFFFPT